MQIPYDVSVKNVFFGNTNGKAHEVIVVYGMTDYQFGKLNQKLAIDNISLTPRLADIPSGKKDIAFSCYLPVELADNFREQLLACVKFQEPEVLPIAEIMQVQTAVTKKGKGGK